MKSDPFLLVLVTAPSRAEARRLARGVLQERLAACVNIVPGIESHYWWQGKRESGREWLLLIKTSRQRFRKLARTVRAHHSYDTPEIIALPLAAADARYARWWRQSLKSSSR